MIVWLGVAVLLVVLYQRGTLGPLRWEGRPLSAGTGAGPGSPPLESAESVLARRMADGEITPAEYLERIALVRER